MVQQDRNDVERYTNPALEDRSIKYLRDAFRSMYGDEWGDFEMETLLHRVNPEEVTPLLIAKVRLLKVMEEDSSRFYRDPMFMLHSLDILNGDLPDQDLTTIPHITSLELIYGLKIIREMYPSEDTNAISAMAKMILRDEGFTFVPKGLEDILTVEDFPEELSRGDSKNKQKGIDTYLKLCAIADRAK